MHAHGMTRVPAPSVQDDAAEMQIEAALGQLVRLLAQHVACDLAANAPATKEQPDAATHPEED